ncbi:MAG: crossover junction endodeoxyribonuclease RuvC [Wenzhouxiangellaceae bacterium]
MQRIIGIDPGSRLTGVGIIDGGADTARCVYHGVIRTPDGDHPQRLAEIYRQLSELIERYQPQQAAIENVFVSRNVMSALKLGQARGAAICALVMADLTVQEYAPTAVKQAVVGRGRADKAQVQHMMQVLLRLDDSPTADAADALAVALCHHHHQQTRLRMVRA